MNVYDFDGTIYPGDSTVDLIGFVMKKYPTKFFSFLFGALPLIGIPLHLVERGKAKEGIYRVIASCPDPEGLIQEFWDTHQDRIFSYYLNQQKPDDVLISASPDFSIQEIGKRLGIQYVIASPVDLHTGKPTGLNNDGQMKVVRFKEAFPDGEIDEFYSDSRHDKYLANLAKKAFFVRNGKIEPW